MQSLKDILPSVLTGMTEPSTNPAATLRQAGIKWEFNTANDPGLIKLRDAAQRFADEIKSDCKPRWLTILGPCGIGKTHLSRKIANWWIDTGRWRVEPGTGANLVRSGKFWSWRAVEARLQAGDFDLTDDMGSDDFAVIDDIGATYDKSGFVTAKLERVLDARLRKWTVITSNLTRKGIAEKLDARIASRLLRDGGVIVELNAMDYNDRRTE